MYCQNCGVRMPTGASFCPECGAGRGRRANRDSTANNIIVGLSLLFMLPLGIVLMWAISDWDSDVKWAITGLIFPPIWLKFIWKVPWLPWALGGLFAALTLHAAFTGFSTTLSIVILAIIAITLLIPESFRLGQRTSRSRQLDRLRESVARTLNACNELIAGIESDIALHLLPRESPIPSRYFRAMEVRTGAQELLDRSVSRDDLLAADERAGAALRELREIHEDMGKQLPESGPPSPS